MWQARRCPVGSGRFSNFWSGFGQGRIAPGFFKSRFSEPPAVPASSKTLLVETFTDGEA
jgi:hypothetical protein